MHDIENEEEIGLLHGRADDDEEYEDDEDGPLVGNAGEVELSSFV